MQISASDSPELLPASSSIGSIFLSPLIASFRVRIMALFHHKAYLMLCPLGKQISSWPASSMELWPNSADIKGFRFFHILGSNMAVKYLLLPQSPAGIQLSCCVLGLLTQPSSLGEKPCTHLARLSFLGPGQCLHQASGWPLQFHFEPFFLHPAQEGNV